MPSTANLQSVLATLKQSVDKLSLDNEQLAARDSEIKRQIAEMQLQLGKLQAQGDGLSKAANQFQGSNPRLAQQVTRLEEENYELDNRTQKTQAAIQLVRQSLEAGYGQEKKLLLQIKGDSHSLPAPLPEAADTERLQKEKLRLMKMIYETQQREASLHASIMETQRTSPLLPAASALAHQQLIKEQIKDLEAQLAAYPPDVLPGSSPDFHSWDNQRMQKLELELKTLERNYVQLKDLLGAMNKKASKNTTTVEEQMEAEKLQGNINDLNRQGKRLKDDLDLLRSQMIELDKRKSHLESMLKDLR